MLQEKLHYKHECASLIVFDRGFCYNIRKINLVRRITFLMLQEKLHYKHECTSLIVFDRGFCYNNRTHRWASIKLFLWFVGGMHDGLVDKKQYTRPPIDL
jgi:hypothetical protein